MLLPETIEALRFLALSHDDMIKYLPSDVEDLCYVSLDDGGEVLYAAEVTILSSGRAILQGRRATRLEGPNLLLAELNCIMTVMIDLGAIVIEYHWQLDKTKFPVTGPYDDIWLVLKRYATLALQRAGLDVVPPTWTFDDFLNFAEFERRIRPNPDRD